MDLSKQTFVLSKATEFIPLLSVRRDNKCARISSGSPHFVGHFSVFTIWRWWRPNVL